MIGIVLISHDDFCVGMLHAAEMICGDLGGQIVTVGLAKDAPVETFDEALRRAVKTVDTGDGIVILADLAGGTPFNRAAPLAGTSVRLFGGVNLAFLLELLSAREDKVAQNPDVFTEIMIASRTKSKCDAVVKAIGNPNIKTAQEIGRAHV